MVLFLAHDLVVVADALAQYLQKVQAQFVRGGEHRARNIRRDEQYLAFFLGVDGGARGNALEYGHFARAVPLLDGACEGSPFGFELYLEKAAQHDNQFDVCVVGIDEHCSRFHFSGLAGEQEPRQFLELDVLENFQLRKLVPGYR